MISLTRQQLIELAKSYRAGTPESEIAEKAYSQLTAGLNLDDQKDEIIGILIFLIKQYVIPVAKEAIESRIALTKPITVEANTFELKVGD